MDKQIVLFIVEGESDKHSFENILNHLVSSDVVKFKVIKGDITVKSNKYTVTKKIKKKIEEFLNEPKNKYLTVKDICKIVHLVDLDGAFIDNSKIVKHEKENKCYKDGQYFVPNIENIIQRNKNKKEVIIKLKDTSFIPYQSSCNANTSIVPYEIYYFSCNLEHVLHNDPNVESFKRKKELSESFAEDYLGQEREFLKFIKNPLFATQVNYQESWEDAIKQENALVRSTNFNLFFKS